ncbi:uncharacterized protein LOC110827986 [Zootermopsis nevadensis]|uniref:39S ribosomal protein L1, mitochondrial n=1 Tax=Zootermopsis nevadensis TaxID=136037 RepID=A0A067RP01_ZOONE|nr:uncharacterized protein LOC110827986 [Zootermopsis nevadensis]KDR21469.1 39S ribosomal protein L1, mitochondrial [Zootermopsis nevadensis]
MAAVFGGRFTSCFFNVCGLRSGKFVTSLSVGVHEVLQVRNYAARKGTREKARKKKKAKVEVKKVGFIPHNLRGKKAAPVITRRIDDSLKPVSPDNVWLSKFYQWPLYSFSDAVHCHRETHHPTVYNSPNEKLYVNLELNMRAAKENRYLDEFTRTISLPHPFDADKAKSVLVFCKSTELQKKALIAGATVAGDIELIKNVQNGELSLKDFNFVVAHPDILPELVLVRGLLKRKFPNQKSGTLGTDIPAMVSRFCSGIEYTAKADQYLKDFGWIFTSIGKLDMDTDHLEENFSVLLKDVYSMKPNRVGPFITKCCLVSLPSPERLKVDYNLYIDEDDNEKQEEKEEDEEEEDETGEAEVKSSVVV